MAETRFGAYSQAIYGDVTTSDTPTPTGLSLVSTNIYSGRPQSQTDPNMYPPKTEMRLYKDGIPADGLINNKVYENGKEISKEQIQAGSNVNYVGIAGELASLGLRPAVGTRGAEFVRDAAAEKKFAEEYRAKARAAAEISPAGSLAKNQATAMANMSDADIIYKVGGVNKEGIAAEGFGVNALMDWNVFPGADVPGLGTSQYGGTGPAQYIRGSRAVTEPDIIQLGETVARVITDGTGPNQLAAARARQQLTSIFENDPSWVRREQARDALSYGLPGYPGGPAEPTSSTVAGGAGGARGAGTMTYTASDGRQFSSPEAYSTYQANLDQQRAGRQSAYDLLFEQFDAYGLGGLVAPLKSLIESGINPSEFTIKLRETDAYKKRFAANQARIQKGLRALSEAEYINLEDQYQDTMRRYGLPQSFYARGDMGRQEGFERFIAGDVSPVELEDRIQTAQNRVTNAPSQIKDALTQFYGAEISSGDILGFVLDPEKALPEIKRKITAAEIGAGATMAGLGTTRTRAEELGRYGVTGEAARTGYQSIAEFLPTAQKLGDIYAKQGMGPFTQTTAEQEVFGTQGAVEAASKRRKLTQLEQAQFSGQVGAAGGALARDRAGAI